MSARSDHDPNPSSPVACFSVAAAAAPGVMPRVLEVFVKRGLVPCQWYSTLHGRHTEDLHIDVQVGGIDDRLREQIAEALRQVVDVQVVLTSEKRRALTA